MLFDIVAISQTENFGNWEFWKGINPSYPLCQRPCGYY